MTAFVLSLGSDTETACGIFYSAQYIVDERGNITAIVFIYESRLEVCIHFKIRGLLIHIE